VVNLTGTSAANTLVGGINNDTLNGGAGNDTLSGDAGNDTFLYRIGDGADTINGGTGTDTLVITGTGANETLTVVYNGTSITTFQGGSISGVESITADLNPGNDTLSYAGTTVNVSADLAAGTASGFTSIANFANLTGGNGNDTLNGTGGANVISGGAGNDVLNGDGGADTLNGDAGNDTLNGGAGDDTLNGGAQADTLIGGNGVDTIDTGAANDNLRDVILFNADTEFGDTVNNFDANGTQATGNDAIAFGGALNTLFDDGINNDIFSFVSGDNVNNNNVAVNLNGTVEGLWLSGANNEGVSNAQLGNAAQVASEFNAEFNITAANGEATLLVINDTNSNSASVWQWVQAAGGSAEIDASELTLIALINANATINVGDFVLV